LVPVSFDQVVDARNLMCPLPVIRTQQKIETMNDGDTLLVIATDLGTLQDVPAWCREHGHEVTASKQTGHECRVEIRVRKSLDAP